MANLSVRRISNAPPVDLGDCKIWTVYRGTALDRTDNLKPETADKVKDVWERAKGAIAARQGQELRINFSKGYITYKDREDQEHRLDRYTDEELREILIEIKTISKELKTELQGDEAATIAAFQVPSQNWHTLRPRGHDACSQAMLDFLPNLTPKINQLESTKKHAKNRMNATNRFIEKLLESLRKEQGQLKALIIDESAHPVKRRNAKKDSKSLDQLENMLLGIDPTGTRDATYWAVCFGDLIEDSNDSSTRPEKAKAIANATRQYLNHRLTPPQDTRFGITKTLGLNAPPADERPSLIPDIAAYAEDTGDLVYTGPSIENFIVYAMMRKPNQPEIESQEALDAIGLEWSQEGKNAVLTMIHNARREADAIENPPLPENQDEE